MGKMRLTDIMMAAVLSQNKYHRGNVIFIALQCIACWLVCNDIEEGIAGNVILCSMEASVFYLLAIENTRRFCCQQILWAKILCRQWQVKKSGCLLMYLNSEVELRLSGVQPSKSLPGKKESFAELQLRFQWVLGDFSSCSVRNLILATGDQKVLNCSE